MRNYILLFLLFISTVICFSEASVALPGNVQNNTNPLYRLPFSVQSGYSIIEGPDSSVIIIWKGNAALPGKILRYDPVTNLFSELSAFSENKGIFPLLNIVVRTNSNLIYGVTRSGGKNDNGILYSLDVKTLEKKTLVEFGNQFPGMDPKEGLTIVKPDMLMGLCKLNDTIRFYTYDLLSGEINLHTPALNTGELMHSNLPVAVNEDIVVFLTKKSKESGKDFTYSFVIYNLEKRKILSSTSALFKFSPASKLLLAKNKSIYVSNYFGRRETESYPEVDFCFARFDPQRRSLMRIQTPPDELTVWGPPLNTDRNGNLIGAFLYGGKDNGGYVFYFDVTKNAMNIVKEWSSGDPGVMTSDASLLDHSNGLYYGFSYEGGKDGEGRFFSLDPVNGNCKEIADFEPRKY